MRRVYSYKTFGIYLFFSCLFAAVFLALGKPHGFFMNVIYILCFSLSGSFLVLPFVFPNYITFNFVAGNVQIVNIPVFSTNKTREIYGSLIDYNSSIFLNEIDHVEIVRLSSAQKRRHVGHRHVFSRYLKIYMKYSASNKYIYISIYSRYQVRRIIKMLTEHKEMV